MRDGDWWTAAVTVGSELLGGLVLHREDELTEADQRILERAALVTALLLLIRRTASEAENRVRGELLEELLTPTLRDPEGLRERARRLGADLDTPSAVVVARVEERSRAACRGRGHAPRGHPRWAGRRRTTAASSSASPTSSRARPLRWCAAS